MSLFRHFHLEASDIFYYKPRKFGVTETFQKAGLGFAELFWLENQPKNSMDNKKIDILEPKRFHFSIPNLI